jgi:hypothetical protein
MPPRRRRPPQPGQLADLPPLKILLRILLLQLAYYGTATVLILFTALVAGQKFELGLILDWATVRGDSTAGWLLGGVWVGVGFIRYVLSTSTAWGTREMCLGVLMLIGGD